MSGHEHDGQEHGSVSNEDRPNIGLSRRRSSSSSSSVVARGGRRIIRRLLNFRNAPSSNTNNDISNDAHNAGPQTIEEQRRPSSTSAPTPSLAPTLYQQHRRFQLPSLPSMMSRMFFPQHQRHRRGQALEPSEFSTNSDEAGSSLHSSTASTASRTSPSCADHSHKRIVCGLLHLRFKQIPEHRRGSFECLICADEMRPGSLVTRLPCGHLYHSTECVLPWLKRNPTCPTCRFELETLPYTDENVQLVLGQLGVHHRLTKDAKPGDSADASHSGNRDGRNALPNDEPLDGSSRNATTQDSTNRGRQSFSSSTHSTATATSLSNESSGTTGGRASTRLLTTTANQCATASTAETSATALSSSNGDGDIAKTIKPTGQQPSMILDAYCGSGGAIQLSLHHPPGAT